MTNSEALREQAEELADELTSTFSIGNFKNNTDSGFIFAGGELVEVIEPFLARAARDAAKEALELAARVAESARDGTVLRAHGRHVAEHIRALAEPGKGDPR